MELREKLGEREKPSEIFAPLAFELFRLQGKRKKKKVKRREKRALLVYVKKARTKGRVERCEGSLFKSAPLF